MTDIAALSIRVDTLEAKVAATDLAKLEKAGAGAERSMSSMTNAARSLATAIAALGIGALAKEALLSAARYETLGVVMNTVGNAAGYTAKQMNELAAGLQKQGISSTGSREALSKMALANIDLTKAVNLANAAQGAAIIMGRTSTEAFDSMTTAIVSGEVERVRSLGVMVDFEGAMKREAAALGKAKEQLTDAEKMQARMNETLAKSKNAADVYENAMGTAGKQLGSMARYLSDLSMMLGSVGLEAFTVAVFGSVDALKGVNMSLQEMMQSGSIERFGHALVQVGKGAIVAGESVAAFWLAWKSTVAIETAMLTLGLLKLELRSLSAAIVTAGGAWNYFTGVMSASLGTMTTVAGTMTSIAAAFSGIMIGKYLADNFRWAAEASLSMGETILATWAKIVGTYKIGVASLSGDQAAAEKELSDKLLTIRMTYLHERAELDKRFAAPSGKPWQDKLGLPSSATPPPSASADKLRKAMEKANEARHEAVKSIIEANDETRRSTANIQAEIGALEAVSGLYGEAYGDRLTMLRAAAQAQDTYNEALKKGVTMENAAAQQAATLAKAQAEITARKQQAGKSLASGFSGPAYDAERQQLIAAYDAAKEYTTDRVALESELNRKLASLESARLKKTENPYDGMKAGLLDYTESVGTASSRMSDLMAKGFKGAEDALSQMVGKGKLDITSLFEMMRVEAARSMVVQPLLKGISSGSLFSGIAGLFSANGNAFGPAGLMAFANGGVVSSPTAFRFGAGGANLGIMGEDGPEAIMPLKRGSDGKLGVAAGGGAGAAPNITFVMQNRTGQNVKLSTSKVSQGDDGTTVTLLLDLVQRNVGGLRTGLQAALGS